jgi:hypothetical protein
MENNSEVEKLKEQYGTVYSVTVNNSKGKALTFYVREVDRLVYKTVAPLIQKDEMLGVESLIKQLWIGGEDVKNIVDDYKALRNAGATLSDLIKAEEGILKKS